MILDYDAEKERIFISFDYNSELVKLVKSIPGRRWEPEEKKWWVAVSEIHHVIEVLKDRSFKYSPEFRSYLASAPTVEEQQQSVKSFTVSQLNAQAQKVIRSRFTTTFYLDGELSGYGKNRSGHAYLELVDRSKSGKELAKVNALCFMKTRATIIGKLARMGLSLKDGEQYRFLVRPDLYLPSGQFQVQIEGIEMGAVFDKARQRLDEVVTTLKAEGIFDRNRRLNIPVCPLRVGLVTSIGSDAYNDFIHELELSGYAFSLTKRDTRMQGVEAASSVAKAIRSFKNTNVDVVVVIRGGGSKTSLADLDSLEVGRSICNLEKKVISGIGHHRDRGVLDLVALEVKTPTAAAQNLVSQVSSFWAQLCTLSKRIKHSALIKLRHSDHHFESLGWRLERRVVDLTQEKEIILERFSSALKPALFHYLRHSQDRLYEVEDRIIRGGTQTLTRSKRDIDGIEGRIQARPWEGYLHRQSKKVERNEELIKKESHLHLRFLEQRLVQMEKQVAWIKPEKTIQRGYAIMRKNEEIIKSVSNVREGEVLTSTLRDGRIVLSVIRTEPEGMGNG